MRRGAPTLYEMRRAVRESAPSAPGRGSVRLPTGVIALAVASGVALVTVAYVIGYGVGKSAGERESLQGPVPPLVDPLAGSSSGGSASAGSVPAVADIGGATSAVPPSATPGMTPFTGDDPRLPGLNYFILATTDPAGASEMVDFCRSNGLDAHIGGGHNGRLRQVVVLPGFPSDGRGSPEIRTLEAKIKQVGAQWKALRRGNSDFRDYYPKLQKSQP
ncbi:MAG: hypothetical protein FGM37_05745 [Phycisphaerales bacterium]|nr:hypothetical protein [Phycisphaerales bacterium]